MYSNKSSSKIKDRKNIRPFILGIESKDFIQLPENAHNFAHSFFYFCSKIF